MLDKICPCVLQTSYPIKVNEEYTGSSALSWRPKYSIIIHLKSKIKQFKSPLHKRQCSPYRLGPLTAQDHFKLHNHLLVNNQIIFIKISIKAIKSYAKPCKKPSHYPIQTKKLIVNELQTHPIYSISIYNKPFLYTKMTPRWVISRKQYSTIIELL